MTSWMMSLWLKNHEESEWPDLSVSQPEDACHVSMQHENHFERAIEEMCSEGFFTVHGYKYVQGDAAAERVPEELYDDVEGKDCTQSTQDEELYEEAMSCQLRSACNFRSPQELPDRSPRYKNVRVDVTKTDLPEEEPYDEIAGHHDDCLHVIKEVVQLKDLASEPRYQNVQINVTKTNLQEEEPYENVRSTNGVLDSKEPRCQNVHIDVTKTAVDIVTEMLHDDEDYDDISCQEQIEEDQSGIYEEIGNQSPALCHSSSTDEHAKNFNSQNEHSYTAEDGTETAGPEDEDLYEEIEGAVISNSVEACSFKNPGSSDFDESSETVGCDEFSGNAAEGEVPDYTDPIYAEIGSLQPADIGSNHNTGGESTSGNPDNPGYRDLMPREYMSRSNHKTGSQSTTGNPDTPGYRELMPKEYMSLRREQASTLTPKDTSSAKKDLAKLSDRRRRCHIRDT